ncbi:oligosaccharide flippase family protein [Acinetobacter towneri]|uniref:oligosaccharide flippase family protein n=1 Tax=Acinetobacter towneri TaxID=202956 RepID=UPI0020970CAD|nr:oligosaccharide flippase family protein [Acinetobacter towneri]MCO8054021.1 oligosaccharide flippase family protein [Acinetobacter towneri]
MKVLKDSFIYLIGELFAKSLPLLMLPYLTRKLGPDGFGELSYYLTWLALFGIFIGLSQEGAVTRYFYFYGNKAIDLVVKAGYLYNILFSTICLIIAWILNSEIIAYITLIATFNSFLSVQLALRQAKKQPIPYIVIQFLSSLSLVIFTVFMLEYIAGNQVINRLLALLFSSASVFFVTYFFINKKFKVKKRFSAVNYKVALLYIFSFGIPLILHQLSFFMKGQIDRIFIYKLYSALDLGVYSAAVQIASILTIFFMALNKALIPYYYEGLKNKKLTVEKIKKYTLLSFIFIFFPALFCYFLPNTLFVWFLGEGFGGVKFYTVIFLVGYGLTLPYLILVNYLFFYGRNKLIASITFLTSVLYVIILVILSGISMRLIPFSLVFSNLVALVILWVMVERIKN